MSTSGSSDYSQNRNQIIETAFQLLGIYGIGRTISAEDYTVASNLLNMMLKRWQGYGYHLWTKQEGVLFITPNVGHYYLGNLSTDTRATTLQDAVITQLATNVAIGATSITVGTTTNMAINDQIGIVLADKSIFWTTISAIPTSVTITLASSITGGASSSNLVYTYTNKIGKPMRIIGMGRYRQGFDSGATSTQFDIPITQISYDDYQNLPTKTSGGIPNQMHYNPKINDGTLYLFQRPIDGSGRIHFTYERQIQDMDSATDDLDLPSEWLEPVTYQLAVRLALPFGKLERGSAIFELANDMLERALAWDGENTELEIRMDFNS